MTSTADNTKCNQPSIRRVDARQLEKLDVASGFTRWIRTVDEKSKEELKQILYTRLIGGNEVWVATMSNVIVCFAIISEWAALPDGKIIDAVETAQPYRDRGIGSKLLICFLQENKDAIVGLLLYPELGYENQLTGFYKKLKFERISEGVMIRLPTRREKLEVLARYLRELRDLYDKLLKTMETESRLG